ncbi:fibroblast growth factor 18-like isoform X2 [Lineus longissimus]|uniref:fibroblast growth factor 18-like isoform X2 n=1 Tax=Lineus longissimus TaxID=88925 RepID=UPI002B4E27D4
MGSARSDCSKLVLAALIVLTQLSINVMYGSALELFFDKPLQRTSRQRGPMGTHRFEGGKFKIYNQCSKKNVQIRRRNVNAGASHRNPYSDLILHMDQGDFGTRIRIQGEKSKMFLCFNKRGRLIARHKSETMKHAGESEKCLFVEKLMKNDFYQYESVANPLWYIGFKKNGKPLKGYDAANPTRERCFLFLKKDVEQTTDSGQGPGPNVDFSKLYHLLNPRHRHEHRSPSRRRAARP